ncbi:dienelactone hydrolase family protein [Pseudonocardia petroleophila]|uniref:Dienelactone hydrolase family protein n=1 Tax=Pseudonocardia petroleophila TaxID=37331 RepID=A0A7G7MDB7_9PSEU|nr:dienelactone hydrolase family protein [Pseudonocardia petroleophila]QNG50778.1 dienelactone hydrolase family protein [Pseudonocardia petroleophila]
MPATTIPGATTVSSLEAHLAVPAGEGPWPGVVVVHEAFGLNDDTRRQADRLAAAGYLAVAPNLFGAGGVRCLRATFSAMLAGEGPAFGDIEATRTWLAGHVDCTGRVGIIGFCLGGGFALGAASRGFDAAAPNYGRLPRNAREILVGACPIVASYGGSDPTLRGAAGKLESLLTELDVVHDVREYPGAGHSFLSTVEGPAASLMKVVGLGPHQPSADEAWARILAWFDTHLRRPAS